MFLRHVCVVTLFIFLNSVIGCTRNAKVSLDEVKNQTSYRIHSLTLVSGEVIIFDSDGGRLLVKRDVIVGTTKSLRKDGRLIIGDPVKINITDIEYLKVIKFSITKTTLAVAGGAAVVFIIAAKAGLFDQDYNVAIF